MLQMASFDIQRTPNTAKDIYLMNYGGWYYSFATYLLKNHGFSWFQVILPPELIFLNPLRQQIVILVTLDCFSWTVGIDLDGYLLIYGGWYDSFVTYLLKNYGFS